MATNFASGASIPELDLRLEEHRGAIVHGISLLRRRMRRDVHDIAPLSLARRHPEAMIAAAGLAGLIAGVVAGRILSLFR